jgi:hypothetical protein
MNQKQLIITLIKDHLLNTKLINGSIKSICGKNYKKYARRC